MSFLVVIDSEENKHFWSRSIFSLSTITEQIKFVITSDSLSISGVNNAKTSHGEIRFAASFFSRFEINFNLINVEGFESNIGESSGSTPSYSFIIDSKSLSLLFKKMEPDLDYIMLYINCAEKCPAKLRYKFMVEIKTKNLIVKKLSTSYRPCLRNKLQIASLYKKRLQKQSGTEVDDHSSDIGEEGRINYLVIERSIPKSFLEKIPTGTEDFKIEIKNNKVSLIGFTKQIMKDKEYLKQPMSVTISLSLDELLNNSLSGLASNETLSINFRLKYFKTFLSLASSTISSEDFFEIIFSQPGEPILFEMNSHNATIQFILISDGGITANANLTLPDNLAQIVPTGLSKAKFSNIRKLHPFSLTGLKHKEVADTPKRIEVESRLNKEVEQSFANDNFGETPLFVPESSQPENSKLLDDENLLSRRNKYRIEENVVIWNNDAHSTRNGENKGVAKKRKSTRMTTEDNSDILTALGPTQNVDKPKGLFD